MDPDDMPDQQCAKLIKSWKVVCEPGNVVPALESVVVFLGTVKMLQQGLSTMDVRSKVQ